MALWIWDRSITIQPDSVRRLDGVTVWASALNLGGWRFESCPSHILMILEAAHAASLLDAVRNFKSKLLLAERQTTTSSPWASLLQLTCSHDIFTKQLKLLIQRVLKRSETTEGVTKRVQKGSGRSNWFSGKSRSAGVWPISGAWWQPMVVVRNGQRGPAELTLQRKRHMEKNYNVVMVVGVDGGI